MGGEAGGAAGGGVAGERVALGTDAEIVARIAGVVHTPFREAWRRYAEGVWGPVRGVLDAGIAAHERALEELAGASGGGGAGSGDAEAAGRYRHAVAAGVLEPLGGALRGRDAAGRLEALLAQAVEEVLAGAKGLPALVRAPLAPDALGRARGLGVRVALKRMVAVALRPIVWRREARDIPVGVVARRHVARAVLPRQVRAFLDSQRLCAQWLGGVERSWSEWLDAVLAHERDDRKACLEAGRALQLRLVALAGQVARASGQSLNHGLDRCDGALSARVAVAGTFVSPPEAGRQPGWRGHKGLASEWDRWAGESAARLDLCLALLEARHRADAIRRELIAGWTRSVREIEAGLDGIDARLAEGRDRAGALDAGDAGLADGLKREMVRKGARLDEAAATLPDAGALLDALAGAAARADSGLQKLAAPFPEKLVVHRVPSADARIRKPGGPGGAVMFREAMRQAFDTPRIERIRAAAAVVPGAMDRVHEVVSELREVAAYGYEAAVAELAEGSDPATVHPALAADGLARAAAGTGIARGAVRDAFDEARTRVVDEFADGMARLVHRTTTDRLTGRYLDARSQVAAEASRGRERWRRRLAEAVRRGAAAFSWIRRRLWPVKQALGIGGEVESRAQLGHWSRAAVAEVESGLPVLYRRLFSFEPVTDARLLAGRDEALGAVEAAWNRWRREARGALALIASPGAGATSFLNILTGRLAVEPARVARQVLRERIGDEAALAGRLSGWLGVGDGGDLDEIARQVLDAPRDALPHLFLVEGTEHLQMRVAGGGAAFATLLSFIQRTSPRIFWVLSVGRPAWQLLERRSPARVGDIERIGLQALGANELKQAILARHRLSGLPLRYVEGRTGLELLRRRPGLRGSARHQRLLESDYFERLHRASLGSVRTALFLWLRSADFRGEAGGVVVRPLGAAASFMHVLGLEQSFALKALLEHGTLTVPEYSEVARMSVAEARHLFRAVRELHVVEAVSEGGRGAGGGAEGLVGADARYRVRPLLAGAVAAHLRSLNILH